MKYSFYNNEDRIIACETTKLCNDCFRGNKVGDNIKIKCPHDGSNRRLTTRKEEMGWFGLCSDHIEDVNSVRLFRLRVEAYKSIYSQISKKVMDIERESERTRKRLLHNLTSINAHCIQELYDLIPQDVLTRNISQQMQTVQEIVRGSSADTAKTILRVMKNNLAMKIEFSTMRFLSGELTQPELKTHPIRKVVLNILHAFFQDFTEKHVHVNVNPSNAQVFIDYSSFAVAIYHVIENATKYILPKSEMHITFTEDGAKVHVIFDMVSLAIPPDELPLIGIEGFSGRIPKKLELSGDGLGMFRAIKLLALNDAAILIKPNIDPMHARMYNSSLYQQNQFIIDVQAL